MLVHDEVHKLGSPANREALAGLSDRIRFRLGLSATPEREYDMTGTEFIEAHVGKIIYRYTLADAIRDGILCPLSYFPLQYIPTEDDRQRLQAVMKRASARAAAGNPMRQEEIWIDLARVYKTSLAKLPVFEAFISGRPELLTRCIVFVETKEYGDRVAEIIHRHREDFHTYYAEEDPEALTRFARGELECLLTCHRLSEGVDIRNIRTAIIFSAARAKLETIQRIGRALRVDPTDPRKRAVVVDFVRPSDAHADDETADQERCAWLTELSKIVPEENADGAE
jgi:superfamily II DNA or RNA helicase